MMVTPARFAALLAIAAIAGFSAGELMAGVPSPGAPAPVATVGPAFAPSPAGAPQVVLEAKQQMAQTTPPAASSQPPPGPCSGVPEATCNTVAGCVWLPGYKVKGGADVQGYCRPAPKSLSSRRPAAAAPKQ